MQVFSDSFATAKAGGSAAEYEDAVCPQASHRASKSRCFRGAVADGATETSYSRQWAQLLVRGFVRNELAGPSAAEISVLQARWSKLLSRRLRLPQPWYAEQKAMAGAFAALVAIEIREDELGDGRWVAFAVGDSCLVHIRNDEFYGALPLTKAADFDNRPCLLGSTPEHALSDSQFVHAAGNWQPDDTFYLMTDAISCWFFRQMESGGRPWDILRGLGTEDQPPFVEWIDSLRRSKALKNDDVTVLRVYVSPD